MKESLMPTQAVCDWLVRRPNMGIGAVLMIAACPQNVILSDGIEYTPAYRISEWLKPDTYRALQCEVSTLIVTE